jgi:hypothetical protein
MSSAKAKTKRPSTVTITITVPTSVLLEALLADAKARVERRKAKRA